MRQFFISSFETLVAVIVVLLCIGVVIGTFAALMSPDGGFLAGIAVLVGGGIYTVAVGGMLYLVLGVHDNTRRTAEAVEQLLARQAG